MNNDLATIDVQAEFQEAETATSDVLGSNQTEEYHRPCAIPWIPQVAGILLTAVVSQTATIRDPWRFEGTRRDLEATVSVSQETIDRRRISLQEARQMALQFMADMEAARRRTAEKEALRMLDLEAPL